MGTGGIVGSIFLACTLLTAPPNARQCPEGQAGSGVQLKVLSVTPQKDNQGELGFRIRFQLSNLTRRTIFIETMERESRIPYFIYFDKRLYYGPRWLFLGAAPDAPAIDVFPLKSGESMQFDYAIPSVSAYRMPPEEGIPVRGAHRARIRYFLTRQDADRARFHSKAAIYWTVSGQFRIDWPR